MFKFALMVGYGPSHCSPPVLSIHFIPTVDCELIYINIQPEKIRLFFVVAFRMGGFFRLFLFFFIRLAHTCGSGGKPSNVLRMIVSVYQINQNVLKEVLLCANT